MTKHGFIIIPKTLLQQIENPHLQEGEIEALLKILMKVNYSETLYNDRCNKNCPCKRGESLFSYRDWSRVLHWSTRKTFRFMHGLATGNHRNHPPPQQYIPCTYASSNMTNGWDCPMPGNRKRKLSTRSSNCSGTNTTASRSFPRRTSPRRNASGKLSDKEQQLAIDNIEVYYFHQTNVNFLLHAGSYLSNKAFLNEYTY